MNTSFSATKAHNLNKAKSNKISKISIVLALALSSNVYAEQSAQNPQASQNPQNEQTQNTQKPYLQDSNNTTPPPPAGYGNRAARKSNHHGKQIRGRNPKCKF